MTRAKPVIVCAGRGLRVAARLRLLSSTRPRERSEELIERFDLLGRGCVIAARSWFHYQPKVATISARTCDSDTGLDLDPRQLCVKSRMTFSPLR